MGYTVLVIIGVLIVTNIIQVDVRLIPTFVVEIGEEIEFGGFVVLLDRADVIVEIHVRRMQLRSARMLGSLLEHVRALDASGFLVPAVGSVDRL